MQRTDVDLQPGTRESFDSGWLFHQGDAGGANTPEYDDSGWRRLNVPHDWSVEGAFSQDNPTGGSGGYLPAGIGWYRKHFTVAAVRQAGKEFIEFDGVYMNAELWVNGNYLGHHVYGYTGFQFDLTPWLTFGGGENLVAVRVDNSEQPNSRWYTGSGIYRHTWLKFTGMVHTEQWGIQVTTPEIAQAEATVRAAIRLKNEQDDPVQAEVVMIAIDAAGSLVASISSKCELMPGQSVEHTGCLQIKSPGLWSVECPELYLLRTEVYVGHELVDSDQTTFGIREISFNANKGFLLNGSHVKINGVCLHHDGGCVGAAVPERIWQSRLEALKEMGCNGIRMSHNPPAPELLDLCDRMGFLVMDEAFDEWKISKEKSGSTSYGYSRYFEGCNENDLKCMLHRDRNHPCVVLWSVGNEIPEQTQPHGAEMLKKLVEICHSEDPTRPVTSACDNIMAEPAQATDEFLELLDVVGYNYVDRWRTRTETFYEEERHKFPHWKIIGSEHSSIGGVRGDYRLEGDAARWWQRPYHCGMLKAEKLWKFTRMHDYVAGDYMWTGVDYLGEARWPNKSAASGVLDLCGFPKDGYFFYKSQWTKKPMVHLFPHWNWQGSEGRVIPVICYTNCDAVDLYLNGRFMGRKGYEFPGQGMTQQFPHYDRPLLMPTTTDLHLSWDVPYECGIIKAVGINDGQAVCEETVSTTENPAAIFLSPDRVEIRADGWDVCLVTVSIQDENGWTVPDAGNLVRFKIEGAGRLIGVDNGLPDSHESFKADSRHASGGLCLAVVQSAGKPGTIRITAEADGLAPHTIEITAG